uniref:Uncharacterized protein n=1 Tax=Anguilla anguilla TaxID=7936 RepID=A0A0E9XXP0_ANGAN
MRYSKLRHITHAGYIGMQEHGHGTSTQRERERGKACTSLFLPKKAFVSHSAYKTMISGTFNGRGDFGWSFLGPGVCSRGG